MCYSSSLSTLSRCLDHWLFDSHVRRPAQRIGSWFADSVVVSSILVVDDDAEIGLLLTSFMEGEGHTVRYAQNGIAGLEAVRQSFPDLIFLDIEMPKLSGPGMAYQLIVEDSGRENIPIIVLSGVPNLKQVVQNIGTPYFMAKPFDLNLLGEMVKRALRERIPPKSNFESRQAG